MIINIPEECFKIEHTFDPKDFAPGVWAGTEGMKLTITHVDLEKRTVTLELMSVLTNDATPS